MEAFGRFLLTIQKFSDRVFISNPPGATLLIWTNNQFLPNISGISIVENIDAPTQVGIESSRLLKILQTQLYNTVPVLHIQYDTSMKYILVNGTKLDLFNAAKKIAAQFCLDIGRNPAKPPNDPSQIKDPFHVWSRAAFDGYTVIKTDIDILITEKKENIEKVAHIIEIKRSEKIPIGKWQPYINPSKPGNDINNYMITMSLCNLLKTRLVTIHHSVMDDEAILNGNEIIDFFTYYPTPNQSTLDTFASVTKRRTMSINKVLGV